MKLKRLILEQFRNYPTLELNFDENESIKYIVGPNAQGKTNILEAVYLLALTKSFRGNSNQDLIQWEQEYGRVTGEFELENAEKFTLEVFLGHPPQPKKSLKKNNVKVNAENFIGTCQIVFFHPEDLNILYLGPDLRRKYLDILNLQISKSYYRSLSAFKRILKQRNALLKEIKLGFAQGQSLEVWNDQMVEHGTVIITERAKTVAFFNQNLSKYYQKIAESNDEIKVIYKHIPGLNLDQVSQAYAHALKNAENADLQAEITTIGPHRDDVEFLLNGRPLATHASRGEYRCLLLALKLLELEFFQQTTGQKTILLLDDVFSELDLHRQKMLMQAIQGHQAIITTTHLDESAVPGPLNRV